MITTESYGCDRHGEDAYQGCALCELESLRSRLADRTEERDDSNRNLTAALKRETALAARLQKIMARCADLLDEDQFNELDAMTRAADPTSEILSTTAKGG